MQTRHLFAAIAVLALAAASAALAEPLGRHFELTPMAGWSLFDGSTQSLTGSPLKDDLYFGGRLNWAAAKWWAIEGAAGVAPTTEDVSGGRSVDFFHASGNLLLTPLQNRYGGPFVFVGGGSAQSKVSGGSRVNAGSLEYGGGARFWMSDAVGVRLEARDIFYRANDAAGTQQNIDNLVLAGGLTFALGATPRDTDGDGVPDKHDKCPNTPKGAKVDANGCPIDSDGDHVYDGLDQCPNTPKGCTVDGKGCPSDADGDGVCDGVDQCAETPKGAKVDAKGCPIDSDGDRVYDGLDQCPNTPPGAKVDAKGCPLDSDGDGVYDGLDQCPDTPQGLKVDAKGCPVEMMERETELLDTGLIRLNNVNFETAKDSLLAESFPTLDAVGALLVKWPQLKMEISGHTDNVGGKAKNDRLSLARARSVQRYLLAKYPALEASQYSTKGYGSSKPVASNKTADGRALNRRVEFKVLNTDVLKKEIERRRMVPADSTAAPSDSTQH